MKFYVQRSGAQFYFSVISSNGNVLGHSENYNNKTDCTHAVDLIIKQAAGATVVDKT